MIANDAKYTHEIKSRIAMAKAAFNGKNNLFTSKFDLNLRKKTSKVLHLEHSIVRCCNLDTLKSRSEILGKFWNVMLKKDGEDKLD